MNTRLAKWLAGTVVILILVPLAWWLGFRGDDELLPGLLIGGELTPVEARAATRALRERAEIWSGSELEVSVQGGEDRRSLPRSAFGAALGVESVLAEAQRMGRSGNPLLDAAKWWQARRGRLNVRWAPTIDAATLAAFVRAEQARVELLPVAGITDGQGFSLPGRDGKALDQATATLVITRALGSGASRVMLPLQSVPAPAPIAMGSPDGALFEGSEEPAVEPAAPPVAAATQGYEPQQWLSANDDDCYSDPPQRPFCDGPRKVPAPHGAAQVLAEQLGLGKLETMARLIRHGPADGWVRAAGGPQGRSDLGWPVASGKLGRGFGYVRRAELSNRIHAGIDIVAARGSAVQAAAPGIVAYSDNRVRGYGNLLAIVHDNGAVTLSAHCQRIFVFAGERVARGQVVAEVGMTGLAMGPHLHFEYHVQGHPADPQPQFAAHGGSTP